MPFHPIYKALLLCATASHCYAVSFRIPFSHTGKSLSLPLALLVLSELHSVTAKSADAQEPASAVLSEIFAASPTVNDIHAVIPFATHVPCCEAGCPLGLCADYKDLPDSPSSQGDQRAQKPLGNPNSRQPHSPPTKTFHQPAHKVETAVKSTCSPGDCTCVPSGGPCRLCCGGLVKPWPPIFPDPPESKSLESFAKTTTNADANYIPFVTRTDGGYLVTIWAEVELATKHNVIASDVVKALGLTPAPKIALDVIVGRHGARFDALEFDVIDDQAKDGKPLVVLGTKFLMDAYALRVTEEYVFGVFEGVDVLVARPATVSESKGKGKDGVKDEL